jgi:hypothetical protein
MRPTPEQIQHDFYTQTSALFLVPTVFRSRAGWFHPLFGAHNVPLCALRD